MTGPGGDSGAPVARPFAGVMRDVEGPRPGSLEERSVLVLKLLAGIYVAGMILAIFPGTELVARLHTAMFNLAAAGMTVVFLATAMGLGRRAPWAVAGIRPLLAILIVTGIYSTAVAGLEGRIKIPWEAGLSTWAVLGAADLKPIPRPTLRTIAMLAVAVAMIAMMLFGKQAFGFGGLMDVKETAFQGSMTVDCGTATDGEPPASIQVAYEWSWTASTPMPNGLDIIVVGWTSQNPMNPPLYLFDAAPASGRGVYPGRREEPSLSVAARAAAQSQSSWQWGVQLAEQGFTPGRVELILERVRDNVAPGASLELKAAYVHLGLWRVDAAPVTCSW